MGGFSHYWRCCCSQAWQDTMTALGWTKRHPVVWVVAAGVFVFTVISLGLLEGNPVAFSAIAKAVSRGVALALVIPVIFAVALVAVAPYRLHQKQDALLAASKELLAASIDERTRLENRLAPKLEFCFWPGCCGLSLLSGYYYIGVRNPTAVTIANALVTISVPHKGVRHLLLNWVGAQKMGEPIDIDPSPADGDRHFAFGHVVNPSSGSPTLIPMPFS